MTGGLPASSNKFRLIFLHDTVKTHRVSQYHTISLRCKDPNLQYQGKRVEYLRHTGSADRNRRIISGYQAEAHHKSFETGTSLVSTNYQFLCMFYFKIVKCSDNHMWLIPVAVRFKA
jgi:hypothetical protein